MEKKFTLKDKYHYFCAMSKRGAKKSNGKELTDFERGTYFGLAKLIRMFATSYNKRKRDEKINGQSLYCDTRSYSDEYLNSLFDNLKDIDN